MYLNKKTVFGLIVFALLSFCTNVHSWHLYDTPGETVPSRVEILVDDSVDIYCHMNLTAFQNQCTVQDLYFVDTVTQKKFQGNDVEILNDTTIKYTLKKAQEQQTTYRCKCLKAAIAETKVYVGYSPLNVTDFRCRSFDFTRMQCNFTKPDNPVLCRYNVSFRFDANYKFSAECNHEKSPLVICEANLSRPNEEIYHFEVYANNSLGKLTQHFDINNTQIMIPAKPGQDFRMVENSTDSATFIFRMPKYSSSYSSKGIQWEVFVKPLNLSEYNVFNAVKLSSRARNEFILRLQNLKYAYYEYVLRLRVRLEGAEMWSEAFTYKFRSAPRRPDKPPRIDVGGFYTDPTEEYVHLYWELLQPHEYNGYNFSYAIENKNGEKIITDSNSASFIWHKNSKYNFKLYSRNHLGLSDKFSSITIPTMGSARENKMHTTPAVHNIYHEKNGTFTLTWEAPEAANDLQDYTVFWCRSKRALLNGCEGSIHFEHVESHVNKFTTAPQEHTLNLAVSANYKDFNTGMHWTECTMNEESDLVKMEPEVTATSATTIKIQWTSEKICPSIFDGYNLDVCEAAEQDTMPSDNSNDYGDYVVGVQYNCKENSSNNVKLAKNLKNYELANLKPYTNYKIQMYMYSRRKVGKTSDPEVVRTWEAAPSQPRQLNISQITNTSASISWLPPLETNGLVRTYTVFLNSEQREVAAHPNRTHERILYDLKDLNSSTSYKVYVRAQTISSSQASNDIHFTTLVGYPKTPRGVSVQDSNIEAKIEWAKANERTDFYEVAITLMRNDEIIRRHISVIIGSHACVYKIPHCYDRNYRTTVDVRAVNAAIMTQEVDENDVAYKDEEQYYEGNDDLSCIGKVGTTEKQTASILERNRELYSERYKNANLYRLYKSEWQRGTLYSCSSGALGMFFVYSASAVLMAVGVFVLFYLMRRKYNKMANIHCTLPAGLDAYVSKDFSGVNGSTFSHDFLAVIKGEMNSNVRNNEIDNEPSSMMQRTKEYHNEERRLLETTSQDSISLNEQTQKPQQLTMPRADATTTTKVDDMKSFNTIGIASNPMFESNFDLRFTPQQAPNCSNEVASPINDYSQATDFATPHAIPQFPTPTANGYIKPNALSNWQNIIQQPPTTASAVPAGYVTVESIDNSKPPLPTSNGYIQVNLLEDTKHNLQNISQSPPQTMQTPLPNATTDSYTTLDQLGKMSAAFPTASNMNRHSAHSLTQELGIPLVPSPNATPGISGYVTPRELTAFGQQQCNFN